MRTRSTLLLAAAVACASLLTAAPAAADPPARWGYGYGYYGEDDDWADDYWEERDRRDRRRERAEDAYRRGYEEGRRDSYGYSNRYADYGGFNPHAHNGYYYREQWYWGQPPRNHWRDCRPDYRRPSHGARLPRGYVVVPIDDWRRYGLYAPPRDHRWARDDSGTYFLLGLATGVILDSVVRGY